MAIEQQKKVEAPLESALTIRNLSHQKLHVLRLERFSAGSYRFAKRLRTEAENSIPNALPLSVIEAGIAIAPFESARTNFAIRESLSPLERCVGRITIRIRNVDSNNDEEDVQLCHLSVDGHSEEPTLIKLSSASSGNSSGFSSFIAIYHPAKSHIAILRNINLSSWMRDLPDLLPFNAISTPATHNSPACYRALPSVRCQSVSITEQLRGGVRFLDVRCQPAKGSDLILVHGAFPISLQGNKKFRDILNECYEFLDANPSEFIVMSLKREGWGSATDHDFSKILQEKFIDPNRWWTGSIQSSTPILGSLRGKMVMMRRFKTDKEVGKALGGLDAEWWPYNTPNNTLSTGTICVQDYCDVMKPDMIESKIQYVLEHLCRASEAPDEATVAHLNFMSASNFFRMGTWPKRIAEKVNPVIDEYLAICHNGHCGVLLADFVELSNWMFCYLVVAMNDRLLVTKVKPPGNS